MDKIRKAGGWGRNMVLWFYLRGVGRKEHTFLLSTKKSRMSLISWERSTLDARFIIFSIEKYEYVPNPNDHYVFVLTTNIINIAKYHVKKYFRGLLQPRKCQLAQKNKPRIPPLGRHKQILNTNIPVWISSNR